MKLVYLEKGKYSVLAEVIESQDGERTIGIVEELENADAQYKKSIAGFAALFKRFSDMGPVGLPYNLFHKPIKNEDLYQFIKGELRLLCFFNENGDAVILSHYEIKKGKRLSNKALNKARKLQYQYYLDLEAKNINYENMK